jgi:MerR family copper efflux transcriptional regulator
VARYRISQLAALVADELRCCPVLTFTLTVTHDSARLDASAPDDARPLLDELVPSPTGAHPC